MKRTEALAKLTALAARQHGVVTRRQALSMGVTDEMIAVLVVSGFLRRDRPGVYVVAGTPSSPLTAVRTALAAVGPVAVASHATAAWLAGLLDRPPATVHALTTQRYTHRVTGVSVHRSAAPPRVRVFQAVPCTDIPRTLVDLATTASPTGLGMAVDAALSRRLVRVTDLEAEISSGSRRGTARLRACLLERGDICAPDSSLLEGQVARLFARSGLPVPQAEVHAGPDGRFRLDYAYPHRLLAAEFNGYTWHHSPEQMASDLARHRALVLEGWLVLVYSWRDALYEGDKVMAEIAAAYRQRALRPALPRGTAAGLAR